MPTDTQKQTITCIVVKLAQLGLDVQWSDPITEGPMVTTYRFVPRSATKVREITTLSQDLALALKVEDVVVRRLPGEGVIGVTVPNATRAVVNWRDTLTSSPPEAPTLVGSYIGNMKLPINFGVDSHGALFRDDLTAMPHLLIAGSTNSGKSTLLNSIIASLCYWRSSDEVRLLLSDTKQVEFGHFVGVPHLLQEPATTKYQTWEMMDWCIEEIERRLQLMAKRHCKNILEYNSSQIVIGADRRLILSYIVLVIDELFDILGGGARGETKIATQKLQTIVGRSRASGIHVIAATQRSSVDVVTGTVKANFPARISFRLPSEADSRTILGHSGAEHLLSRGDMWFVSPTRPAMLRLHSAYALTEDIKQCLQVVTMQHSLRLQADTATTTSQTKGATIQ